MHNNVRRRNASRYGRGYCTSAVRKVNLIGRHLSQDPYQLDLIELLSVSSLSYPCLKLSSIARERGRGVCQTAGLSSTVLKPTERFAVCGWLASRVQRERRASSPQSKEVRTYPYVFREFHIIHLPPSWHDLRVSPPLSRTNSFEHLLADTGRCRNLTPRSNRPTLNPSSSLCSQ